AASPRLPTPAVGAAPERARAEDDAPPRGRGRSASGACFSRQHGIPRCIRMPRAAGPMRPTPLSRAPLSRWHSRGDLMGWLYRHRALLTFLTVLVAGLLAPGASETWAQKRKAPPLVAKEAPGSRQQEIRREQQPGAKESVEADVSARNIAITSNFNGTEIVVFGAVDGSQQPSAESG